MNIRVRGGRVVDPSQRMDQIADLFISNGLIHSIAPAEQPAPIFIDREIDAKGSVVAPGFVDLHTHLREPGQTHKEDLRTGTQAAAAGGFTSILCMPNTNPVNDSREVTELIVRRAKESGICRVFPVGAISQGLRGTQLAPLKELKEAGCVAFSDDGRPVNDAKLLREAFTTARDLDCVLIEHCEELTLSPEPKIHEGSAARKLGLKGIPRSAETIDAMRTMILASETNARVHLAHVSCAETVEMIRQFKKHHEGLTAETTPHHLLLTDESLLSRGTNAKMYPPLREKPDCEALLQALIEGTIDAIATDHAPHTADEKHQEWSCAPNGVIGLETALPMLLTLVSPGGLTLSRLVECLSTRPAEIVGLEGGTLKTGAAADVVVFDPQGERTITERDLFSKSKNSPFINLKAKGKVLFTLLNGNEIYPECTA